MRRIKLNLAGGKISSFDILVASAWKVLPFTSRTQELIRVVEALPPNVCASLHLLTHVPTAENV
jgi:hypothetical protein